MSGTSKCRQRVGFPSSVPKFHSQPRACACPHPLPPALQQARRSAVAPALCCRSGALSPELSRPRSSAGGPAELQQIFRRRTGGTTAAVGGPGSTPTLGFDERKPREFSAGTARAGTRSKTIRGRREGDLEAALRRRQRRRGRRKPRLVRFDDGDVHPPRLQLARLTPQTHPQRNRLQGITSDLQPIGRRPTTHQMEHGILRSARSVAARGSAEPAAFDGADRVG